MAGALDQRGFVGSNEAVSCGLVECFLQNIVAEALRGLRQHYPLPRQRCCDQSAVGCAFDLLDCVDRWQAGDRGAVFLRSADHVMNYFPGDEWTNRIVHEDDVVIRSGDRVQRVRYRVLPVIAAFDQMNVFLLNVFAFFFQPGAESFDFIAAQRNINFGNFWTGCELA